MHAFSLLLKRVALLYLTLLGTPWIALASPPRENSSSSVPHQFDYAEEGVLYWKTPHAPLKTNFFHLSYLTTLWDASQKHPYFLLKGRPCLNCSERETEIYAIRPSGEVTRFVYPGKVFDSESPQILLHSRFFYGSCLTSHPDRSPVPSSRSFIVVFQQEKIDKKNRLQSSVLIAEPTVPYLQERLWENHLPNIHQTLAQVKKKVCHEIPGLSRNMISNARFSDQKIIEQRKRESNR